MTVSGLFFKVPRVARRKVKTPIATWAGFPFYSFAGSFGQWFCQVTLRFKQILQERDPREVSWCVSMDSKLTLALFTEILCTTRNTNCNSCGSQKAFLMCFLFPLKISQTQYFHWLFYSYPFIFLSGMWDSWGRSFQSPVPTPPHSFQLWALLWSVFRRRRNEYSLGDCRLNRTNDASLLILFFLLLCPQKSMSFKALFYEH